LITALFNFQLSDYGSVHILGDLTIKHIASLLYTDRT